MDRLTGEEAVAAIERRVPRAARVGNLDIVAVELDMILAGDNDIREVCSVVILQQGDIVELEAGAGPVWVHLKMDILAVGVVNELDEVFADAALQKRGMVVQVSHPDSPSFPLIANPIRFSDTPLTRYDHPPTLGEHTEAVLREVLGATADEIEALKRAKAI